MLFPSTIIVSPNTPVAEKKINELIEEIGQKISPNNPDIFRLDPQTGWGIDAVRQIRNFFSTKPFNHSSKIVLIYQAQNLQLEAQNALLKSLEEPGENRYFFLITSNPQLLLPTIISRCHLLRLSSQKNSAIDHFCLSSSLQNNFTTSEKLASDKETLPQVLEEQLNFYHHQLLVHPLSQNQLILERLIKTIQMIKANVEPKSALDYFFLTASIN